MIGRTSFSWSPYSKFGWICREINFDVSSFIILLFKAYPPSFKLIKSKGDEMKDTRQTFRDPVCGKKINRNKVHDIRPPQCGAETEELLHRRFGSTIMKKDPVCGMNVKSHSSFSCEYRGKLYEFCSTLCLAKFVAEPVKYTVMSDSLSRGENHTSKDEIQANNQK